MVATSGSNSGYASTANFNATGLSAVDEYFGVADDTDDHADRGTALGQYSHEKPKEIGVKSFMKANMKRRRKEDKEENYDSSSSSSDGEEEGRTFIAKNSDTKTSKGQVSEPQSKAKIPEQKNQPKMKKVEQNTKESKDGEAIANESKIVDDDTLPWHRRTKRKKCRSRQKNIRKDNRDVKPSFTRDPTAPGYRPLTDETKQFLRTKNSKTSFSPMISKLNDETA